MNYFEQQSPLTKVIPGFKPRKPQQQLAQAIEKAISNNAILVAEAATGTGKTFAYLIPTIISQKSIIISTGTRHLQDQLFTRDIPLLQNSLGIPFKAAILKGRSNYLCHYRIEQNRLEGAFYNKQILAEFQLVVEQLGTTQSGDISELTGVTEDSQVWPFVTSTQDNCLGQDCSYHKECFILKARRKALEADIVVINHHLFFADNRLKNEGFGELLPNAQVLIFDEAHQIPEIASHFFGRWVSSRQFISLVNDTHSEYLLLANDMKPLQIALNKLEQQVKDMRLAFFEQPTRAAWRDVYRLPAIKTACEQICIAMLDLIELLAIAAVRSKGMEHCWQRAQLLLADFEAVINVTDNKHIHWYETFSKSFHIHLTPLDIADSFKSIVDASRHSTIFTSATLSVQNNFDHFLKVLGLEQAKTLIVDTPFDYKSQALLYLPRGLPDPSNVSYHAELLEVVLPLINACNGGVFFLFTSHRAMQKIADLLAEKLTVPLLVQGQVAKNQLLQQFMAAGNAVLLGTASFWEGVDVKGQALSCVIIDKLPFESPQDPVVRAKSQTLQAKGEDPFYQYQLPKSVISLKQGIGRLIRDSSDRGLLVIADPRLTGRAYGQVYFESLPNIRRTRSQQTALDFLSEV